ncbi:hypothetical protein [Paenibacillus sacheonensis]|uniref:Uncharacterized protein n=1 Tax=Paenibacillus sacheonensis TaxID=742054 RepID=A0A7X5BXX8_9BACL|nr:hypothetical protein [Paenibacillus sacheonensis]MBM7564533.1 hypothetical protein [Paenibacillus sacheonensis]NBC69092.1 hypothetical protein [Paenibacillus sacheonensis]
MKIRPLPIVLTAVITAALLVGGWFLYRNEADLKPLDRIATSTPGVIDAKPVIGRSSVTLDLTLNRDANLRNVYDTIATEGDDIIGSKELKLNITESEASGKLEDVWASMLFEVAQAMDHRSYADIPKAMQEAQSKYPGIQASSEMDDTNVYITLKDDKAVKYVVLPRASNTIGVWPNA